MPARGDYYWRKSDSHPVGQAAHRLEPYLARQAAPQAAEAGAIGGIVRGQ
jgi:hypothetical protein